MLLQRLQVGGVALAVEDAAILHLAREAAHPGGELRELRHDLTFDEPLGPPDPLREGLRAEDHQLEDLLGGGEQADHGLGEGHRLVDEAVDPVVDVGAGRGHHRQGEVKALAGDVDHQLEGGLDLLLGLLQEVAEIGPEAAVSLRELLGVSGGGRRQTRLSLLGGELGVRGRAVAEGEGPASVARLGHPHARPLARPRRRGRDGASDGGTSGFGERLGVLGLARRQDRRHL